MWPDVWTTGPGGPHACYNRGMAKEPIVRIRIYKKEQGIIRRLAFRKNITAAEVIRQLIKGV
jgi:hypothetical protein